MKKHLAIIAITIATGGLSAFGDGWVDLGVAPGHTYYDEFTTPGAGVMSSGNEDVTFMWAPVGSADLLPSVGSQFGQGGGSPVDQVATNGVVTLPGSASDVFGTIDNMLADGWTLAYNENSSGGPAPTGPAVGTTAGRGSISYNNGIYFQLQGSPGGESIEIVELAWDAASGTNAITTGDTDALGWSNPFNYLTGSNLTDPHGAIGFANEGMNQFGVAPFGLDPVPEPTTLALAGLGGLSLLILRRRKT